MQQIKSRQPHGAGLGLRRDMLDDLLALPVDQQPDFYEVAPENWLGFGGRHARQLRAFSERVPLVCHGLSLSIGGPHPLNTDFLRQIRQFLDQHQVAVYSEHLSYTGDHGYLYDLLPIPMTDAAVRYVAERVMRAQDILGRRLVLENVSTYAMPSAEMSEADFVRAVVERADCELLLDINNVYVNSVNHGSDARGMITAMPTERIRYLHMAGHYIESDGVDSAALLIDTHGADVNDAVWDLLEVCYQQHGVKPTLLERDFNLPPLTELLQEVAQIKQMQAKYGQMQQQPIAEQCHG